MHTLDQVLSLLLEIKAPILKDLPSTLLQNFLQGQKAENNVYDISGKQLTKLCYSHIIEY